MHGEDVASDTSDARHPSIQLNLYRWCDELQARLNSQLEGQQAERVCSAKYDNVSFDGVHEILHSLLGYSTQLLYPFKDENTPFRPVIMEQLDAYLSHPALVGILLNIGEGHYTAIGRKVATCNKEFAYMDSMTEINGEWSAVASMECEDKDGILSRLFHLPVSALIVVLDAPGAYESVTVRRIRQGTRGGRRRTLRRRG